MSGPHPSPPSPTRLRPQPPSSCVRAGAAWARTSIDWSTEAPIWRINTGSVMFHCHRRAVCRVSAVGRQNCSRGRDRTKDLGYALHWVSDVWLVLWLVYSDALLKRFLGPVIFMKGLCSTYTFLFSSGSGSGSSSFWMVPDSAPIRLS